MTNPNHWKAIFPEPDPDSLNNPDTPMEMFPHVLALEDELGYEKADQVYEMLTTGHLLEAARLIVGEEFLAEPAETVHLCRAGCTCENHNSDDTISEV